MKNKILILILMPICIFLLSQAIFKILFISFLLTGISLLICLVVTNKNYSQKEKLLAVMTIIFGTCGLGFMIISLLPTLLSFFLSSLTLGIIPINKTFFTYTNLFSNNTLIIFGIIGMVLIVISVILLSMLIKQIKTKKANKDND